MSRTFRSIARLLVLQAASACGYRLANEAAVFGPDVREIRLRIFENESNEPGLGQAQVECMEQLQASRGHEPALVVPIPL